MLSFPESTQARAPRARGRGRRRGERGVIIVLTSMMMLGVLSFTAIAVDIGMRNQLLARDQHAVDTATLAARQLVAQISSDYANGGATLAQFNDRFNKASARAKELLAENLGPLDWTRCGATEPGIYASNDIAIQNYCIRFVGGSTPGEEHAEITLPKHSMNTIFGRVAGTNSINISALANATGDNCVESSDPALCGTPSTTTAPPAPTTTADPNAWCENHFDWDIWLVAYDWNWDHCKGYYSVGDTERDTQLHRYCVPGTYALNPISQKAINGHWTGNWTIDEVDVYLHFDACESLPSIANNRDNWLDHFCNPGSSTPPPEYYTDSDVYWGCEGRRNSSWQTWNQWQAAHPTTTTTRPPSTSTTSTTVTAPAPTTTQDVDLYS